MKQRSFSRRLEVLISIILFLSLLISGLATTEGAVAHAQSANSVCLTNGTVELSLAVTAAVKKALERASAEMSFNGAQCFAVVDLRDEGDWLILSLVGLSDTGPNTVWSVSSNGVWADSALVHYAGNSITASVAGTMQFSEELAKVPENIVPSGARSVIDPLVRHDLSAPAGQVFRFPFQLGYQVYYGTKDGGVHPGEFSAVVGAGSIAVDLMSDGNSGANHAPNQLVAAAAGTVVKKCSDTAKNSTYILVDNGSSKFLYAHIRSTTAPALWAVINNPGDSIGEMVPGTFNDGVCGYANQSTGFFSRSSGVSRHPIPVLERLDAQYLD